jgi:hypothetical protein
MKEPENILLEYIKLLVEKKIREADVSDGTKAKWGSKKHISDLKRRLKEAEYWRDKQKKGSEKRSYYKGVVNDIKRQLKNALRDLKKED